MSLFCVLVTRVTLSVIYGQFESDKASRANQLDSDKGIVGTVISKEESFTFYWEE